MSPHDMIKMMNSVVENGTGRRARLDGIVAAGKTGTTNAYRDAWFMGYTGNYVCGVWFGNDNYDPTNRMTGGSLPAMTWHNIMAYAHQGIDIKQLPGIPVPKERTAPGGRRGQIEIRRTSTAAASDHAQQTGRRYSGPASNTCWMMPTAPWDHCRRRCPRTRKTRLQIRKRAMRSRRRWKDAHSTLAGGTD